MAKDAMGTVITLGVVGGLGYWLYSTGLLNSLFGSPAPAAPVPTTPAVGTNPTLTTPAVVTVPPPPPVCSGAGVLASLLNNVKRAQGPNGANYGPGLPGTLTVDEWGYYLDQMCTGLPSQYHLDADSLFPGRDDRGGELNWSAFSGYAGQAGLSAYPAWAGRNRTALPPGLRRTLPARARAMGRPTLIGTRAVRRAA